MVKVIRTIDRLGEEARVLELKAMANIETIMGSCEKKPVDSEQEVRDVVRKSIVANRDIKKGEYFVEDMVAMKRPGTGLKPSELNRILGKKIKTEIKKDQLIDHDFLEPNV